jgi:hypothetical protein
MEPAWNRRSEELRTLFPGLDHDIITTGAQTTVFASSVAALDACASSLAFWCSYVRPNGVECDVDWIVEKRGKNKLPFPIPKWADEWLSTTSDDPQWTTTTDYRHRQLHRVVPRSTITGMPTARVWSDPDTGEIVEVERTNGIAQFGTSFNFSRPAVLDTYREIVDFAIERWSTFWTTLAAEG